MINFFGNGPMFGCGGLSGPSALNGLGCMGGTGGMFGANPMMAMAGMMQMMETLMMGMGGELPGCVIMPGNALMSAANPMFGCAGPRASIGAQDFLGSFPCDGGAGQSFYCQPSMGAFNPYTWGAGLNGGTGGVDLNPAGAGVRPPAPSGHHYAGSVGRSVAPQMVSEQAAPGTAAMLERAGSMEGMHGVRDRDQLKKITGRLDPAKSPWCAAFAMNMLEQHGVLNLDGLKNRNYTPTIERWARDKGIYGTPDKYTPKPGDAIMFDWAGQRGETDHIGIVEKVENGRVYTIEGNAGNKVQRRSYKLSDKRIDGYVVTNSKQ